MIVCPKCKHAFPESTSSREAFELFHALRDDYAVAQGLNKVEAKDTLCVLYGVSLEYGDDFEPPKCLACSAKSGGGAFSEKVPWHTRRSK